MGTALRINPRFLQTRPRFEPAGLKKARSVTHKLRRALEKAPGLQEEDLVTSRAVPVECTTCLDSQLRLLRHSVAKLLS